MTTQQPATAKQARETADIGDGRPILGGQRIDATAVRELVDPYRREALATVGLADATLVDRALDVALAGHRAVAAMPVHARAEALRRAIDLVRGRKETLASTISRQTGKAIRDARREIDRSTYTLTAAAAAIEQFGEAIPSPDALPGGEGLTAFAIREPLGVVAAVTPFNAPFNLVMHKVAPALAAGNAVVVKPAHQAPLSALQVAEVMLEAGFPPEAISVLPGASDASRALVADPRVDAVSFTGGRTAAEAIGAAAPLKRLLFELGGNSPNLVHGDADLDWAASALVAGGFSNTGQSCNSVQRVIVHRDVAEALIERLVAHGSRLVTGDPLSDTTDVGTLVDEPSAARVEGWLAEAEGAGATRYLGGARDGALLPPTIVANVGSEMRIACEEVFGPVLAVLPYDTLDDAIGMANATAYGLQGAVFTRSLEVAFRAAREIRTGAVFVNRSSNFRLDHLPFGGLRDSGTTREGGRHTLEALTQVKLVMVDATMSGSPHPLARR
jgi:acyl-CoA reductase-like NAD-dependent aldehyde dehydrogenase